MNRRTDNEQLLDDVFAVAVPADFREALLGETLHQLLRRRRFRQTRHAAALIVALGLLAVFIRQNFPPRPATPAPMARTAEKSYETVRTQPLPAGDIVTTHPLAAGQFVASAATVETIQTTTGNFRVLNDDELLALVASHPAVLIRTGPHSEELVFVNPQDANGFPVN